MKVGDCPSCHAPLEFKPGSGPVKVCEYCNTVVLRGPANLEQLGKVAQLVDTDSPLSLNLQGRYSNSPFTIVGRVQKRNASSTWDEWCLQFDDARTGWLAEAEGAWHLMFSVEGVSVPGPDALRPLTTLKLRDRQFVVEETGLAETVSAQGQLPDFAVKHAYVEATGRNGVFASVEYPDEGAPEVNIGSRVTLAQLGFDAGELRSTPKRDAMSQARCTQCNGMLELKAPDAAKRVGCPYCGALLDVSNGALRFLQMLEKPPREPKLALGSTGTLDSVQWVVIAFLIRSCRVEGTRYEWEEYLLWHRSHGFRWLMNANNHWTMLTPVAAGEVAINGRNAHFNHVTYRAFQEVFTTTDFVTGECYWPVAVGETAKATEYVAPPKSLNLDETQNEVTFTEGRLLEPDEVKKAFHLRSLGAPQGIAPAQPNPYKQKANDAWKFTALWAGFLAVLVMGFAMVGSTRVFFKDSFEVSPQMPPGSPEAQRFSEPFEVPKKVPLKVTVEAPRLDNNWLGVDAALVNTATGEIISVYNEVSYYSGTDDGEQWSEGSRDVSKQTAEVDPGAYVLRLTPQFEAGRPTPFTVTVAADSGPGFICPCLIFILLLVVPIYYSSRSSTFETRRWNEAVFQTSPGVSTYPYASSSSDDD